MVVKCCEKAVVKYLLYVENVSSGSENLRNVYKGCICIKHGSVLWSNNLHLYLNSLESRVDVLNVHWFHAVPVSRYVFTKDENPLADMSIVEGCVGVLSVQRTGSSCMTVLEITTIRFEELMNGHFWGSTDSITKSSLVHWTRNQMSAYLTRTLYSVIAWGSCRHWATRPSREQAH